MIVLPSMPRVAWPLKKMVSRPVAPDGRTMDPNWKYVGFHMSFFVRKARFQCTPSRESQSRVHCVSITSEGSTVVVIARTPPKRQP